MAGAPTALVDTATGRELGRETARVDVMTIEYQATPFRAERFLELYRPGAVRVLAYGASGYVLIRSEEDPDHFIHLSFWEDRADFERYWLSREMQKVREQVAGLHGLPVLPHWNYLVERGQVAPSAEGEVDGKLPGSQEGIALVGGRLERARSADSSDLAPASTSLAQVLAELGVSEAGDGRRRETIAEAAYGGTLTLSRLRVLRRAGLLPYDVADLPPDESG